MRLTRKKAIALCIELWTWCARTGKDKSDWPKWGKYKNCNIPKNSNTLQDCWFCEYGYQRKLRTENKERCDSCPYRKKYKVACYDTTEQPSYYKLWENAKSPEDRKKYAKLFLEQIKSIEQRN